MKTKRHDVQCCDERDVVVLLVTKTKRPGAGQFYRLGRPLCNELDVQLLRYGQLYCCDKKYLVTTRYPAFGGSLSHFRTFSAVFISTGCA